MEVSGKHYLIGFSFLLLASAFVLTGNNAYAADGSTSASTTEVSATTTSSVNSCGTDGFVCSKYNYYEGRCFNGWQCIDGCLKRNLCTTDSGTSATGSAGSTTTASSASTSSTTSSCDDINLECLRHNFHEGLCYEGWFCHTGCLIHNLCSVNLDTGLVSSSTSSTGSTGSKSTTDSTSNNAGYTGVHVSDVTVKTDKTSYNLGDTIQITGTGTPGQYVTGELWDPNKRLESVFQVNADSSGAFSAKIILSKAWTYPGIWKVLVDAYSAITVAPITVN